MRDVILWCMLIWLSPSENFRTQEMGLLNGKMLEVTTKLYDAETIKTDAVTDIQFIEDATTETYNKVDDPVPPDRRYPVRHAGLPLQLAVYPLPLENSDHELNFNVSWQHSPVSPASDYSLEVRSITDTADCRSPLCYEYNIPGDRNWWMIPAFTNPVAETCAVRPGCAYKVRLIAHPWDGHTSANLLVELDECVANVCSCAHSPRLPQPEVSARRVKIHDDMFANISWSLPPPKYRNRLPPGLGMKGYIVSLGKQMVSDAHPAPWFANIISRHVDTDGSVFQGDVLRWILLPLNEPSLERGIDQSTGRSDERKEKLKKIDRPDVKLLARVNLIDDRGCVGPAGNATAFNPAEESSKFSFGTYAILVALGVAWIMGAVFVLSARVVKHVLKSFRPAPVSAPPETVCRRPAWFPLQSRTCVVAATATTNPYFARECCKRRLRAFYQPGCHLVNSYIPEEA